MGDEDGCLGQDIQLRNHLAKLHIGRDVLQAFGFDAAQRGEDIDVQIPDRIEENGVILRPVVEGGSQRGIEQGPAVVRGRPGAEGAALADLYAGEDKAVIKALVIRDETLLHHDEVQVALSVEDLLHGHLAAAVFLHIALGDPVSGDAHRVIRRYVGEGLCHRIAVVGGVAGVEHDIRDLQDISGHGAGDARKVVENGIGPVLSEYLQYRVDVGTGLVQEQEGHDSRHAVAAFFFFALFRLLILRVVRRHPRGNRDELCAGGFDDAAEVFRAEVGHTDPSFHQLRGKREGRIHMSECAEGYDGNMHGVSPFCARNRSDSGMISIFESRRFSSAHFS